MCKLAGTVAVVVVASALAFPVMAGEPTAAPDGKPLFLKFKCSSCHTVAAQGIEKHVAEGEPAESTERKPPDLSGVGLEHDAAWIAKYLTKKEAIEGRRHEKKFRGSEVEIGTLSGWLASLQSKAAPGAKPGEKQD